MYYSFIPLQIGTQGASNTKIFRGPCGREKINPCPSGGSPPLTACMHAFRKPCQLPIPEYWWLRSGHQNNYRIIAHFPVLRTLASQPPGCVTPTAARQGDAEKIFAPLGPWHSYLPGAFHIPNTLRAGLWQNSAHVPVSDRVHWTDASSDGALFKGR